MTHRPAEPLEAALFVSSHRRRDERAWRSALVFSWIVAPLFVGADVDMDQFNPEERLGRAQRVRGRRHRALVETEANPQSEVEMF